MPMALEVAHQMHARTLGKDALMGFLSFLRARRQVARKKQARKLAIAAVESVIDDDGIDALLAGSLVLDDRLTPSFCRDTRRLGGHVVAVAAIRDLPHAAIFRNIAHTEIPDELDRASMLRPFIEQLVDDALARFGADYPAFASLV